VPLIRSLWLAKKANRSVALHLIANQTSKQVTFRIISKDADGWRDQDDPTTRIKEPTLEGTVKRGSATCPCCGYTTPVAAVRTQLSSRRGGTRDACPTVTVVQREGESGVSYRLPSLNDRIAAELAEAGFTFYFGRLSSRPSCRSRRATSASRSPGVSNSTLRNVGMGRPFQSATTPYALHICQTDSVSR
jgi:hypothetical protein